MKVIHDDHGIETPIRKWPWRAVLQIGLDDVEALPFAFGTRSFQGLEVADTTIDGRDVMASIKEKQAVPPSACGEVKHATAFRHQVLKAPDPGGCGQIVALFHAHESTKACIF